MAPPTHEFPANVYPTLGELSPDAHPTLSELPSDVHAPLGGPGPLWGAVLSASEAPLLVPVLAPLLTPLLLIIPVLVLPPWGSWGDV